MLDKFDWLYRKFSSGDWTWTLGPKSILKNSLRHYLSYRSDCSVCTKQLRSLTPTVWACIIVRYGNVVLSLETEIQYLQVDLIPDTLPHLTTRV